MGSHIGPQVLLPPLAVAPQHQEMDEIQSLRSSISSGGHALRVGLGTLVGKQIQQANQDMDESSANTTLLVDRRCPDFGGIQQHKWNIEQSP